jgi:fructokinase
MRLGVDLGGTKIEIIALDERGVEVLRRRVPTPRGTYTGIVEAVAALVTGTALSLRSGGYSGQFTLGVAHPGAISPHTGRATNSNSVELNGQPFDRDIAALVGVPVRFANDANCLAVSEAVDGAGAGEAMVFAAILGTGVGAGIAINGAVWEGPHRIAGEWGHNPLPWPSVAEVQGAPRCYCGLNGCNETWLSGPGFAADHARASGLAMPAEAVILAAQEGNGVAQDSFDRYCDRLARALAQVVNLLDPGVIVLGGGMSKVGALYERLPRLVSRHVFSERFATPIRPAAHGDSSGVRGAAWLWGR